MKAYILSEQSGSEIAYAYHPESFPSASAAYLAEGITESHEQVFRTKEEALKAFEPHRNDSTCKPRQTMIKGKYECQISCWVVQEVEYNPDEVDDFTVDEVYDAVTEYLDPIAISEYPADFEMPEIFKAEEENEYKVEYKFPNEQEWSEYLYFDTEEEARADIEETLTENAGTKYILFKDDEIIAENRC